MKFDAGKFLVELQKQDIYLWVEDGQLAFDAPDGAFTDAIRTQVLEHKDELIRSLSNLSLIDERSIDDQTINKASRSTLPLSFAQQRLWFLDQFEPNSAFYNIPMLIRLMGQLDVGALEKSFYFLIARHESLRTTFATQAEKDGQPIQVIHSPSPFALSALPVASGEEAQEQAQIETTTPFNLREGPLMRVQLLQLSKTDHLLVVTMHHIISDGWSLGVLVAELTHAYSAYATGNEPTLPDLPIQYADFAVWQRDYLGNESANDSLEQQRTYWRKQLTGIPTLLELPTDRPRPPVQSHRGARYAFQLDRDLAAKLNQLAQRHDATLFMVLLAAFNVLLARYSRQDDIVVGSPIANRNRAEIEGLIGFFVNTLVLRTHLTENQPFTALLEQVRQTTLEAYQHQDLPFEQLIDELDLERTLSYSPLFQVMLVLQNAIMGEFASPDFSDDLAGAMEPIDFPFAKFDLTLSFIERAPNEGLLGTFEYATDLFDEATIVSMVERFTLLLEGIVERPHQPVLQLPMLTDAEYHQIVHEWNDTAVDFGEPQTIHALFEQQVARTPDAIAVVFEEEQITYQELNARANQLAHRLIQLGTQADTLIAVAMERSIEMIVSVLAVLKAGGAYVPVDPTYPDERIHYMLADSAAPILLTQSHLPLAQESIEATADYGKHIIAVDAEIAWVEQPVENPLTQTSAQDLAYVIYTSGSTGQPKGVMIAHHNLFNLLNWTHRAFQMTAEDRLLARTTLSFDVATRDIFLPLTCGASILLTTEEQQRDLQQLVSVIKRHRASISHFTPTLLNALLDTLDDDSQVPAFRVLLCGAEPMPLPLAHRIYDLFDGYRFNAYGPTEATVTTCLKPLTPQMSVIPLGPPTPNNTFYILDDRVQLVPIGIAGELHIGGAQLARGYLNRPELTAERFIEHPQFGRLYKTGDLCRWLSDGTVEFLGRTDFQVKIRGFRIELGEIENALLEQAGVREAVVLAREETVGDKRLVAYVVQSGKETELQDEDRFVTQLRDALQQKLPDYMIPSAFVMVEAMPFMPNGKLDRRALPVPAYVDLQSEFVSPRNPIETALVQAFTHVLRVDQMGVHDNFFRMGGDSILSIQVVSRVLQQGYTVSVKDIFQYPTIAELAASIATNNLTSQSQVIASQEIQSGRAPLLPIQRRFLDANQPEMHHFNQALLLTVKQPIDGVALESAVRTLLYHHDALRFQYSLNEDQGGIGWQQQYLPDYMGHGKQMPLDFVDLSPIAAEDRPAEIERIGTQAQASLDPVAGDLVRLVYFDTGEDYSDGHRLLIVIHHLAVDGVSWRILVEDLATLLEGGELPSKTSSFRDWAEALQGATENGYFDPDIRRWLEADLLNSPGSTVPVYRNRVFKKELGFSETPLPLDKPEAINTVANTHHLTLTLSAAQTEHLLRTLPDQHDVTLDAVLLTALTETLTAWSQQPALRVKFESYGRQEIFNTINLNRTIGWFTSAYPLQIPRFEGSAVKRIRYTLAQLRRVDDGGISFGALLAFHPDEIVRAQFAGLPTAPVVYNYLGQLDSLDNQRFGVASESAGLTVSPEHLRDTLLDSNALIVDGQLQIHWTISPQIQQETAESLLNTFQHKLETLMAEALQSHEHVAIPSDFENADLSISGLASLLNNLPANESDMSAIETIYQLSPMQSGMLFDSQLNPHSGTYIEQSLLHIDSPDFDMTHFIHGMQQVIDHHESLRATFHFDSEGMAVQVIYKQAKLPVTLLDWQLISDDEHQTRLQKLADEDRLTDFDFSQAPLLRLHVIQRTHNGYDLLFTSHHLLMDRWSADLFWAAVQRTYAQLPLPQAAPYQAYIHHLRQQPEEAGFWQAYLSGFYAPTPLPALPKYRQAEQGTQASFMQTLSPALSHQLTTFARAQGLTLSTLFQATWALLLARYTGEDDVVFGLVTSGRAAPVQGIESAIGLFINTLPFRVQVDTTQALSTLLQQVAETQLALQQREHTSLVDVQRWSDMPPETKLFESILLFQNTPRTAFSDGPDRPLLDLRPGRVQSGTTGYPLVALVIPASGEEPAMLVANYDTALYDATMIERILTHWQQLLKGLVSYPDQPVYQLSMLPDAEYTQIVHEWNDTAVDFGEPQTLHALFEQQVVRTPDALAVVFGEEKFTYAQLNARANQLAHYLIELGVGQNEITLNPLDVGAGKVVGLALERSVEMVVAVLAILKAGAAYLPLDMAYPTARIAYLLEDSHAEILLTTSTLGDEAIFNSVTQIHLDTISLAEQPTTNPVAPVTSDSAAFLIYTSGSTGNPKGVLMPHASLWNLFEWQRRELPQPTRTVQLSAISFDVSCQELFTCWHAGGTLYLIEEYLRRDTQALLRFIDQFGIERLFLPYVLFNALAVQATTHGPIPTSLRDILPAGEQLILTPAIMQLMAQLPNATIYNLYGPTETHVVTWYPLTGSPDRWPAWVPVGYAIDNATLYILDEAQRPVPIGVPGELYIGGKQHAHGYLNRPELTMERFIEHPEFGHLYKTGDLCRWLAEGSVEWIGRTDFQVKLRGYRIEPGEVERILLAQPGVREAVVLLREDVPGDKRIVAYLIGEVDTVALRQHLVEQLPDYMVPSAFMTMDAMPLTPSGKLDRRSLPKPDYADTQAEFVAPRTVLEQQLADIWCEVLNIEQVGVYDSFFALGGHSLLATQVVSRVRSQLNLEVPLKSLFEASQLGDFARVIDQVIDQADSHVHSRPDGRIQPASRTDSLPLSFAQQRLWFLDQLEPDSALYNMSVMFRLTGQLDVDALEQSFSYLTARHESLRTTFNPGFELGVNVGANHNGRPIQVIHPPSSFTLLVMPVESEAEALQRGRAAATIPFNLSEGPLLRVQLLQISATDHLFLVTMHHIISDGWSLNVLMEELTHAYQAYTAGNAPTLTDLPIQYADFAIWQQRWIDSIHLRQQLDYWKIELGDTLPVLDLPLDFPRPHEQVFRGANHSLHLPQALSESLHGLSHRQEATLFMTLLAAFNLFLARYAGQEDILIGTPIAGRNHVEVENLIGIFLNTLVLRTDLSGNPSFIDLLQRVKQTTLDAYEHQDVPFEKLIEELQPERDLSRTPIFQVWFNMLPAYEGREWPGLQIESVHQEEYWAKFDLAIYIQDHADGIFINTIYNTELFTSERIEAMLCQYCVMLEKIVQQPDKTIGSLASFTSSHAQTVRPTTPFRIFPKDALQQSIVSRFEGQVAHVPSQLAIQTEHYSWTYHELNAQANQIAHHLYKRQAACQEQDNGGHVALLFGHDAPMIAAMLGVLKAGKSYVPLDPNHPQERLAYILADSQAEALLTDNHNLRYAQTLAGAVPLVNIDEITETTSNINLSMANPSLAINADTLAYLLYTSGSTGQPKGVIQNHSNVLHFIRVYTNNLHISKQDRLTMLSSYGFDASVMSIYGALLNGATLCPFDLKQRGIDRLAAWLQTQRITIYHSTPTVFRHFIQSLGPASLFPTIRLVVMGGEALNKTDVDAFRQSFSTECLLVNGLGPTESTVSLQFFVDHKTVLTRTAIPVGYPVENTDILLLDETGQESGFCGEIALRSPHVALGYWRDGQTTARAFLADPLDETKRIYRTGDQGRYLPDGSLEFIGRLDSQVKIRGFRIELGEIENTLLAQEGVREAVVLVREDALEAKRLVAYVVPSDKEQSANLHQELSQHLPDYMIPSAFVMLETMPLTPNGKLDRRALPAPVYARSVDTHVPAETLDEARLVIIWQEVLGIHSIGVEDNFFELGGHSLLATQLVQRMYQTLQKDVSLRQVFTSPTIRGLLQGLDDAQQITTSFVPLRTVDHQHPDAQDNEHRPSLFLFPPAGGVVFSYATLLPYLSSTQPVYAYQAPGIYDDLPLFDSLEALAIEAIQEMKSIQPHGPYTIGGWSFGGMVAFEIARQLTQQGDVVSFLGLMDTYPIVSNVTANYNDEPTAQEELQGFFYLLGDIMGSDYRSMSDDLFTQASEQQEPVEWLLDQMSDQGIPLVMDPAIVKRIWRIRKRNSQLLQLYQPQPYAGSITFFCAEESAPKDAAQRWEALASQQIDMVWVKGEHNTILHAANVERLGHELEARLQHIYQSEKINNSLEKDI